MPRLSSTATYSTTMSRALPPAHGLKKESPAPGDPSLKGVGPRETRTLSLARLKYMRPRPVRRHKGQRN